MQYATNCASPWTFCFPSFTNLNPEYLVELKILSFLVRKLSASDHFVIVSLTWKGKDKGDNGDEEEDDEDDEEDYDETVKFKRF